MSGSNFLDQGDLRHPLVNTGGFTAAKEILFLHADEANYKARLDGSGHAVRSSVRAFALRHSIQLYVTCKLDDTHLYTVIIPPRISSLRVRACRHARAVDMYDCHTEPTWYALKPDDKQLLPSQPVARHTIGANPARCANYETTVGGVPLTGSHDCALAESIKASAARIAGADVFPLRCRDDLALLANELGLLGKAAEVGTWAGAYAAKNLRAWRGAKYCELVEPSVQGMRPRIVAVPHTSADQRVRLRVHPLLLVSNVPQIWSTAGLRNQATSRGANVGPPHAPTRISTLNA